MIFGSLRHWKPDPDEFQAPLRSRPEFEPALDRLCRGIDNTRIDVRLSETFMDSARLFVRHTLLYDVSLNYWGETPAPPDGRHLKSLRESLTGMTEFALDPSRPGDAHARIQLLQLAVCKYLLQLVEQEFLRLQQQLKRTQAVEQLPSSARAVEVHERLVTLGKEWASLRFRVSRKLFRELMKLENLRLAKLRKSVLGRSWPTPKSLLYNPMLQMPSLLADEQMMEYYTLVCTDTADAGCFDRVNRQLMEVFRDYVPVWSWPPEKQVRDRVLRNHGLKNELGPFLDGVLNRQELEGRSDWFDLPQNLDRIVFSAPLPKSLRLDRDSESPLRPWKQPQWRDFHQRLLRQLLRQFMGTPLERSIHACHAAPTLYREINGALPVRVIAQYLAGELPRKQLWQRFGKGLEQAGGEGFVRRLEQVRQVIQTAPGARRRRRVLSFLRYFLHLRRDLKLARQAHRLMERVRLLERVEDLELSSRNGSLHDFPLREELKPEGNRIRNHVVLKADLRGSTYITRELREQGLNPASYFSLNFFDPITKLLESFGARKVFVEGDAVILSIYEYEDTPFQWLCVSHACGLARKILQVVEKNNIENRRHGLPPLELGLGLAFSDEAPTFLYDEGREIMISPAINLADRLSSCSARVRDLVSAQGGMKGVSVYRVADNLVDKEGSGKLLRYNVNGIELDVAAFFKLKSELALRKVELPDENGVDQRYYVGRYPDLSGEMHWLVVRESEILLWDDKEGALRQHEGRLFYEVISDHQTLQRVIASQGRRPIPPSSDPAEESKRLH